MQKLIITLFLLAIFLIFRESIACTTVIAGKNTTKDGSILFAKAEDDKNFQLDYLWYIDRKIYTQNSVMHTLGGLEIPQIAETYAYFWDQTPKTKFSNMLINEWGVAFGSNACTSREDDLKELEKSGEITQGGIGFNPCRTM